MIEAWKLFEEKAGLPRSLVHGINGSRTFKLDANIEKDLGTPGFNVFSSLQELCWYLPKFKVRALNLYASKVLVSNQLSKTPNYLRYETIHIPSFEWDQRIKGSKLL